MILSNIHFSDSGLRNVFSDLNPQEEIIHENTVCCQ